METSFCTTVTQRPRAAGHAVNHSYQCRGTEEITGGGTPGCLDGARRGASLPLATISVPSCAGVYLLSAALTAPLPSPGDFSRHTRRLILPCCCAARMKIVRPMTQADSASSGKASTGGWRAGRQPEGRGWEEKGGGGEVVRGLRQRRDRGGVAGRMW